MAWAFVADGQVVEITDTDPAGRFHPALEWLPCPEDCASGWTYDGAEFAPPQIRALTLQQQALTLLAGPIMVRSATAPDLAGEYAIDQATQLQMTSVAVAINSGLGLPGGGTTFNWPDRHGASHPWTEPQFIEFAKGVMNFVYACAQVAQGHGDALPSASIALA
jgi:hypothetical protein